MGLIPGVDEGFGNVTKHDAIGWFPRGRCQSTAHTVFWLPTLILVANFGRAFFEHGKASVRVKQTVE